LLFLLPFALGCQPAEDPDPPAVELPTITTSTGAEMVLVPAGTFDMGSSDGKPDEAPPHEVTLDAFYMDRTEVTQAQFQKYGQLELGAPSHFKGDDRPVEQVSWAKAAMYCNLRSKAEGLEPCYDEDATCNFQASGYRLPTEAEWEYACRAGGKAQYCFGSSARRLGQFAWCKENSSAQTQPVAQKKPNAWGLFDMHGNVAEWCNDVYDPGYYAASPAKAPKGPADGELYVLRGGAWDSGPEACRASARIGQSPGFQDACFARDAIGFRCVRRAPTSGPGKGPPKIDTTTEKTKHANGAQGGLPAGVAGAVAALAVGAADEVKPTKTALVYGDVYLRHKTRPGHPERPERASCIAERLEKTGLLKQLFRIQPTAAAEQWITAVHSPVYVQRIKRLCQSGEAVADSGDTPVCRESFDVALAAAGGVLAAVDAVVEGKVRNAFCAIRPPGHHATRQRAMGFCLLNNVAIAARYAQQKHKLARILIVDWDVHHGNGTQAIFYDDPTVFYFSVHQWPFYPGTGGASERGEGKALGTKLNVPLPAGSGDREYRRAFEDKLKPAALEFRPDFVLISAGFDAHAEDLLGGMKVSTQGFADLTRIVRQIAEQCCKGRLVSVLEGGYNLERLAESAEAHIRVLQE
jgi:acetoin utilization deacetylase AcuC-like enzyme/formylglycine-generating enzyme required for sulfatase activity